MPRAGKGEQRRTGARCIPFTLSPFIALKKDDAWRAAIVLLSAGGLGTVRIMRRTQVQVLRLARTTQSPSNLVPQSHPRGDCRA